MLTVAKDVGREVFTATHEVDNQQTSTKAATVTPGCGVDAQKWLCSCIADCYMEFCYVLWFQGRSQIWNIVGINSWKKTCCRSFASVLQLKHLSLSNRIFKFLTQALEKKLKNPLSQMVNNPQEYPQHGMMRIFTLTDGSISLKSLLVDKKPTEKPKQKPSFAHHPCANVPWKDQRSSPSNASGCNRHDCKPQLNVDGKTDSYHLCSPKNSFKNCWIQTTYLIHPILVARNNHHQSIFIL